MLPFSAWTTKNCFAKSRIRPLSSIRIGSEQIGRTAGRRAWERLLRGKSANEPIPRVAPVEVITRQSTDVLAVEDPIVSDALQHIRAHAVEGLSVKELLGSRAGESPDFGAAFHRGWWVTRHLKRFSGCESSAPKSCCKPGCLYTMSRHVRDSRPPSIWPRVSSKPPDSHPPRMAGNSARGRAGSVCRQRLLISALRCRKIEEVIRESQESASSSGRIVCPCTCLKARAEVTYEAVSKSRGVHVGRASRGDRNHRGAHRHSFAGIEQSPNRLTGAEMQLQSSTVDFGDAYVANEHQGYLPKAENNGSPSMQGWANRRGTRWEFDDNLWSWQYVLLKYVNRSKPSICARRISTRRFGTRGTTPDERHGR